jgi:class 3 adenylate cyclase
VAYSPRRAGAEFRYIINFDARAVLSSIRAPTLILHRREFAVIPQAHAFYLAEHIAGSRLELLPGADMDVLLPGDERPLELIESFLANVRPAESGERALVTALHMRIASSQQAAAYLGGTRWREKQDAFRAIVHAELERFQGREAGGDGAGFLVSFDGPARALRFASSVRQAVRDQLRMEIRVGLHIGECQRSGDTLAGAAVEVGAGVLQATQAGEILATAAVRDLVAGSGLELRGVGAHALDGVAGKWEVYALVG